MITFLSREDIPYDDTLPRLGFEVDPSRRTEIWMHHTVTVDNDSTRNTWETLDEVKAMCVRLQTIRPDLGKDVPYNLLVFCMADGGIVIAEGRGLFRTGAHTAGHNTVGIGAAWVGDFQNHPAPATWPSQLKLLGTWFRTDLDAFTNLSGSKVFGHRDQKATACPGDEVYDNIVIFVSAFLHEEDDKVPSYQELVAEHTMDKLPKWAVDLRLQERYAAAGGTSVPDSMRWPAFRIDLAWLWHKLIVPLSVRVSKLEDFDSLAEKILEKIDDDIIADMVVDRIIDKLSR